MKNDVIGFYKLKPSKKAGIGKAYLTYSGVSAPEFFEPQSHTEYGTEDLLMLSGAKVMIIWQSTK